MRYDLLLIPRSPGQPWGEAVAAARAREGQGLTELERAERTEQFERIVSRLRDLLGELLAGTDDDDTDDSPAHVDERDGRPSFYGEVRDPDTDVVVYLYEACATVSVPIEEQQEDPEAFAGLAAQVVEAVAGETGWAVFDPQTAGEFGGTFPSAEKLRWQREGDDVDDRVEGDDAADRDEGHDPWPAEDPFDARADDWTGVPATAAAAREVAQQRRRARRYLLVGAVVTPVALWLLLQDGGVFAWLALAIGLVDLVVGARAWAAARG